MEEKTEEEEEMTYSDLRGWKEDKRGLCSLNGEREGEREVMQYVLYKVKGRGASIPSLSRDAETFYPTLNSE